MGKRKLMQCFALLSAVLIFTGCSGGGSSVSTTGGSSAGVSGIAATGDPIANATVTLVDSTGTKATGTTGTDGSFNVPGTAGLTPPFMLKIAIPAGSTYYSVSADANKVSTVNITPLTDMIVRTWYNVQGSSADTAFGNPALNPPPTPTEVKVIATVVGNLMQSALQAAGVDTASFNPISTPFKADGTGVDSVIHNTTVAINSTTGEITVAVNTTGGTQNSTITPSGGSVNTSTTVTTTGGDTSSAITSDTVVPTNSSQSGALDLINSRITDFINTINQKGTNLSVTDIAPYFDPNFMDNGMNAAQREAEMVQNLRGLTLSFTGLQLLAMDASVTSAEVAFNVSMTRNGITATNQVHAYFKLISGSWFLSGNGNIANAYVTLWGWDRTLSGGSCSGASCYSNTIRFEVDDPESTPQVTSVTVSGPGLTGAVNVPVICDSTGILSGTNCGSSYGNGTRRAFQIPDQAYPWWPAIGSQYTFTLTTASGSRTITATVNSAHGFDSLMSPILADYPAVSVPGNPTFASVLGGTTIKGSVYVPIWGAGTSDGPHYNYEGPNGQANGVSNQVTFGTWDAGFPIPGQMNNFTIVIPAATVISGPSTCSTGSGTCYNITYQGQTAEVQAEGWIGADACDFSKQSGGESCTNSGIQIQ